MRKRLACKVREKFVWPEGGLMRFKVLLPFFLVLVLFPALAFASPEKSDRASKHEDYTQVASVDSLDACVRLSAERPLAIIKCGVSSETPSFFRSSSAQHFYWRGKVVDNELDHVAEQISEQIFLNAQAAETKQIKSNQAFINGLLIVGILAIFSIVGFICWGSGVVVVFSSIPDLLLNVGIPILGGIIVFIGSLCSENGHLYGINFSYSDIKIFLLIWFSLWIFWNAVQAFRHNNVFLALLVLVSRITTPVFIVIIWSWVASAIDRFSNHGFKSGKIVS